MGRARAAFLLATLVTLTVLAWFSIRTLGTGCPWVPGRTGHAGHSAGAGGRRCVPQASQRAVLPQLHPAAPRVR